MAKYFRKLALSALAIHLSGCGMFEGDKSAPPAQMPGEGSAYSLQSGEYNVTDVRDLNDGCGKDPLRAGNSIKDVAFILKNDGKANVSIDFCIDGDRSVSGEIRGNGGTLAVHHNSREKNGNKFTQDCRLRLNVTADNTFEAAYIEDQTNRNLSQQRATNVAKASCTTSMTLVMQRRAQSEVKPGRTLNDLDLSLPTAD